MLVDDTIAPSELNSSVAYEMFSYEWTEKKNDIFMNTVRLSASQNTYNKSKNKRNDKNKSENWNDMLYNCDIIQQI